jgi:hypothetical protein
MTSVLRFLCFFAAIFLIKPIQSFALLRQRRLIIQPGVARHELPWVTIPRRIYPERVKNVTLRVLAEGFLAACWEVEGNALSLPGSWRRQRGALQSSPPAYGFTLIEMSSSNRSPALPNHAPATAFFFVSQSLTDGKAVARLRHD